MPNLWLRRTNLTNIMGRMDYISSKNRQENLLAVTDTAAELLNGQYWSLLAKEEQEDFRLNSGGGKAALEGMELNLGLPNDVLQRMSPQDVCNTLANQFTEDLGIPCAVALHFNRSQTNLHAHILYSDRYLLDKPYVKIATRNLFYDEDGKRRYKKSDVLDATGQLRPKCRIIRKGEEYERHLWSPANKFARSPEWLSMAKEWAVELINDKLYGDVPYQLYDPRTGHLPQQHVGKKLPEETAERVREYNRMVRTYNKLVDREDIPYDESQQVVERMSHQKTEKNDLLQKILDYYDERRKEREAEERSQLGGIAGYVQDHKPNGKSQDIQR